MVHVAMLQYMLGPKSSCMGTPLCDKYSRYSYMSIFFGKLLWVCQGLTARETFACSEGRGLLDAFINSVVHVAPVAMIV